MPRRLLLGGVSLFTATLSTALVAAQVPTAPPQPVPAQQVDDSAVPVIRLRDEVDPNQQPNVILNQQPNVILNQQPNVISTARFSEPPDPNEDLLREINRLHKETEDLAKERAKLEGRQPDADSPAAVELAQMRQRLSVVLQRMPVATAPGVRPPNPMREGSLNPRDLNPTGPTGTTSPTVSIESPGTTVTTSPHARPQGDPFLQSQALFRSGQYKEALAAYRSLQPEALNVEERLLVQYLCACCLRKLGKLDEAATIYRQVADAREDDFLTECSLWHLGNIGWRRDIEKQLADIRAATQTH